MEYLLLSLIFLVIGNGMNLGFYSAISIFFVFLSFTILFYFVLFKGNKKPLDKNATRWLVFIFVFFLFLSWIWYGGIYQIHNFLYYFASIILLGLFVYAFLTYFLFRKKISQRMFICFIVFAFLLKIIIVFSVVNPPIDVFDFVKYGALEFSEGKNPYQILFHQIYLGIMPDYYAYLPGMILLTSPLTFLFKDPRFTIILFELFTVLLMYRIYSGNFRKISCLIFLFFPLNLFILEQSYVENIIVFFMLLILFAIRKKKLFLLSLASGILISLKQYNLLFAPLLFWEIIRLAMEKRIKPYRYLIFSVLVFLSIVAPFFFWSIKDFVHDTFFVMSTFPPRYEGLTISSFVYDYFHLEFNSFVFFLVFGICYIIGLYSFYKKRVLFSESAIFIFFSFFIFNKWAFVNFYYFAEVLLLFSILEKFQINEDVS